MASIEKRVSSRTGAVRYVVRYRDPSDRQHEKPFETRRAAENHRADVRVATAHGSWVDPRAGRRILRDYGRNWIKTRPGLRPRTRETYESQFELHIEPMLGDLELGKLTAGLVRAWHSDLSASSLGANTVAKCYRLLRSILTTAVSDELITRNPCKVDRAGVERAVERPVATVAQVGELADAMPEHLRAIVLLAGFCGLRLGELLGLERRHVDLLHATITIEQQEQMLRDGRIILGPPKSDAGRRSLALPQFLVPELESHLARFGGPGPTGRVFRGANGGTLYRPVLHQAWLRASGKVDVADGFRFHDLRHTANTLTAAAGASTAELMSRMGHASPAAALRYQHATRERDTEIARLLGDLVGRSAPTERAPVERLA